MITKTDTIILQAEKLILELRLKEIEEELDKATDN